MGIRNRDPFNRTAISPRLRPRGYRNQHFMTIRCIYLLKFEFIYILRVTVYRMIAEAQAARKLIAWYHISTCLRCRSEFIAGSRKWVTEICMVYASPQVIAGYCKVFVVLR